MFAFDNEEVGPDPEEVYRLIEAMGTALNDTIIPGETTQADVLSAAMLMLLEKSSSIFSPNLEWKHSIEVGVEPFNPLPIPDPPLIDEKDFNPDHHRSSSALFIEERDESVMCILQVKDVGALVMRTRHDDDGKLVFAGLSEFTNEEIKRG